MSAIGVKFGIIYAVLVKSFNILDAFLIIRIPKILIRMFILNYR
jgi:hypothetical protein